MSDIVTVNPKWSKPPKKRFVIVNRETSSNDVKEPDIEKIFGTDRPCFVFDTVNRNLYVHEYDGGTVNPILLGNTIVESANTGPHNEVFNDYVHNTTDGLVSYSFIAGFNNIVKYSDIMSSGGAAFGHYNKPDTSYLFTVGNGSNENNRSNILTATGSSIIIGYNTRDISSGKYVKIENGTVYAEGGIVSDDITELRNAVKDLQEKYDALQTSYNNLYSSVSDIYWIDEANNYNINDAVNDHTSQLSALESTQNNMLKVLNSNTFIVEP